MSWQWPAGVACGFLIALVTTPAGVSGAVLLLPVQLCVLRVPSPAVTPTNLIFNVVAVPGGLLRFWHERRLFNSLSVLLIAGALPGVIAGAIIRVEYLSGGRAFMFIAAGVLLPLGLWLLLGSQRMTPNCPEPGRRGRGLISLLALAVGVAGGIYGIGGGSLLAPVLIACGFSAYEVAPATLLATFLTSIAGIATFEVLQLTRGGSVAPEWIFGPLDGSWRLRGQLRGRASVIRRSARVRRSPVWLSRRRRTRSHPRGRSSRPWRSARSMWPAAPVRNRRRWSSRRGSGQPCG